MTTIASPPPSTRRVGLAVFGSIAAGVLLGLVLVLVVFAGESESQITGAALVALGAGYVALAASSRSTAEPQAWALPPGVASIGAGLALVVLEPGDRLLGLAGWIWPVLLLGLVWRSFAGARRSLHHWSRRAFLYPSLLLLLLVAAGGAVETVAKATSTAAPATGRTYLVNGHRLYLSCAGTGGPTVVLVNGLGERTPSWATVQRTVAASVRVCVFDRAGQGWSGGGAPGAQDAHQVALDLHELLRAARLPGPYVLAGHSVGGAYALVYAAMYPKQVAGMALIDSSSPDQFELPDYPRFYSTWRRVGALLPSLARVGGHLVGTSSREYSADRVEFNELPRVFRQAKALRSLHGKPLAVVTADRGAMRGWAAAQAKLLALSSNGFQLHLPGATHATVLENESYARAVGRVVLEVSGRAA